MKCISINDMLLCVFLSQIMLVDGYKGQKVQDVKKPIQKMLVERVRLSSHQNKASRYMWQDK